MLLKKCSTDKNCMYFRNEHGMSGLHEACLFSALGIEYYISINNKIV